MAEQLIISISGMRGIVGENLTPSIAAEYGCAFGKFLKNRHTDKKGKLSVCIGRDSRSSGQMLKSAVATGLCTVGIDVVDLGLVTTPGVGIMVRELQCNGGVIITASHNPIQYNGIKLCLGHGIAPPADVAEQIRQYFFDKHFALVDSPDYGRVTFNEQTDATHIARVLAIVDKEAIAAKKFKAVLDSVNGAGGRVTKKMLAELGCEVIAINDEPSGIFAHRPEPTARNLTGLCRIVKEKEADIGFAQDPDADRLAIVDEAGTYIGEEYTLALAAKYIFSRKRPARRQQIFQHRGCSTILPKRPAVRSSALLLARQTWLQAMLKHNCIIGGEGNGGVIDLRVGPIRDSLVAIALVLQLMAETGKTVSQLAGEIGSYYMSKDKFAAEQTQAQQILKLAKKTFADAKLDTTDGCRFDFDDGWLHMRAKQYRTSYASYSRGNK